MSDEAWGDLPGSDPGHTSNDAVIRIELAEGVFVPNAVLDDDEGGGLVHGRLKQLWNSIWADGFVRAYNIVEFPSTVERGLAYLVDLDFVIAVVLAFNMETLLAVGMSSIKTNCDTDSRSS